MSDNRHSVELCGYAGRYSYEAAFNKQGIGLNPAHKPPGTKRTGQESEKITEIEPPGFDIQEPSGGGLPVISAELACFDVISLIKDVIAVFELVYFVTA